MNAPPSYRRFLWACRVCILITLVLLVPFQNCIWALFDTQDACGVYNVFLLARLLSGILYDVHVPCTYDRGGKDGKWIYSLETKRGWSRSSSLARNTFILAVLFMEPNNSSQTHLLHGRRLSNIGYAVFLEKVIAPRALYNSSVWYAG